MLVPGVLWGAVALFLACSTTNATDEAQHAHQSTNDTQAQPKPEALIGQHWGPKPRQPARIPVIVSYRDPPLPHTLYTHALDRIQRVKSVSRGSLEDGRHLGDSGERGLAGLDPSPVRSVHSMTAEETWTLLGYPFSRPHASFGTRQHSTKGRGPPRHTAGPRQVQHQQTLRPLGPHPYPPMPPTRPHASRPRFSSRPLTPNPPPHPRVPINARPMPRPSTRPPPRPPPRPLPRPLPRPRPPLLDIKPIPTPRPPGTFTPDSLSVHDVAGPPYVNTAPTYILARSDVTNTTATTTTTLPSTTHKVWVSPFDPWQPKTSTSASSIFRPSLTPAPGQHENPWASFGNPDWLNKWDHGWDQNWPFDWSTKKDPGPTDANDSSASSSPDNFPAKDTTTQDAGEDFENYVPVETLMETLLKNHRLPDETTPHPSHDPQQTTTQLQLYNDGASDGAPRATTILSVSRYSEIPLTKPKPHKNRDSFPVKHKHRYPPRPYVRHREGPQEIKPLPPRGWERPPGSQTPPGKIHRKTHKKLTEWSGPWRPDFAAMVPVATRRRIQRAISLQ